MKWNTQKSPCFVINGFNLKRFYQFWGEVGSFVTIKKGVGGTPFFPENPVGGGCLILVKKELSFKKKKAALEFEELNSWSRSTLWESLLPTVHGSAIREKTTRHAWKPCKSWDTYTVRYCWWNKSCTSWLAAYLIHRVLYIPGGCWGFLPSTVCPGFQEIYCQFFAGFFGPTKTIHPFQSAQNWFLRSNSDKSLVRFCKEE